MKTYFAAVLFVIASSSFVGCKGVSNRPLAPEIQTNPEKIDVAETTIEKVEITDSVLPVAPEEICTPESTSELCKKKLEEMQKITEGHANEIAGLQKEIQDLNKKLSDDASSNEKEVTDLRGQLVQMAAEKTSLSADLDNLKKVEASDRVSRNLLLAALRASKDRGAQIEELKAEINRLESDTSALMANKELSEKVQNLKLSLEASEKVRLDTDKVTLSNYISILDISIKTTERAADFAKKVLKDSALEDSRKAEVDAQIAEAKLLRTYLKDNNVAKIQESISNRIQSIAQFEQTSKVMEEMYAIEKKALSSVLEKKNAEILKLTESKVGVENKYQSIVDQANLLYKVEYEKMNQLELSMVGYLKNLDAILSLEAFAKRDAELKAAIATAKAGIVNCEKMEEPDATCINKGQKYYNLLKQHKIHLIEVKFAEMNSAESGSLAEENKTKLKDLWMTYQATLGKVIDLRGVKSISDKDLETLKTIFSN